MSEPATLPAALRLAQGIEETRDNYLAVRELRNVLAELLTQTLERTKEAGA